MIEGGREERMEGKRERGARFSPGFNEGSKHQAVHFVSNRDM